MNYERDRAWAEVSLDRLADNYHKLSEFVGPSCKVLCVIKGMLTVMARWKYPKNSNAPGARFWAQRP